MESRAHAPDGYNVTFQPFGQWKGVRPVRGLRRRICLQAAADAAERRRVARRRVAEEPDGSLFIAETQKRKAWRVTYRTRWGLGHNPSEIFVVSCCVYERHA